MKFPAFFHFAATLQCRELPNLLVNLVLENLQFGQWR